MNIELKLQSFNLEVKSVITEFQENFAIKFSWNIWKFVEILTWSFQSFNSEFQFPTGKFLIGVVQLEGVCMNPFDHTFLQSYFLQNVDFTRRKVFLNAWQIVYTLT